MATANFQARLDRIQRAQEDAPIVKPKSFREPGMAGVQAVMAPRRRKRRHPVMEHLVSIAFGVVLGCLAAVAFIGLFMEGAPWGPGTALHGMAYYPIMASLGVAPILMIVSVFVAANRPAFALFSLGYVTGIVVTLLL